MEAFEKFVGSQVKAVYQDGERTSVARGKLTDVFIKIQSADDDSPILIRVSQIIKIQGIPEKQALKAEKSGSVVRAK